MKFPIPEKALASHTAILGKTGSGKTSTEKLIIEHVVAEGARVCVLDTIKSDWWGITSSASGKSAGLPFKILGGPRGHVPLHSSAGKVIGQLVATRKLPLSIIDMADFEAGGIQRFFVDFAQSLFRNIRGVVYLVIEEAHEIAPKERAGFSAENMSIHWAKKLATGSRTKGIRLIVATQRAQALHNAVLGSCETLIAHRLTLDADQEPVIRWLKNANREMVNQVADSLSSLPTGTGWVCSGEARLFEKIQFPKFKTFDNTATPTDDGAEIDVKTAQVDQDQLRALIGDAVKQAEADDPKQLRGQLVKKDQEITALKRQLEQEVATKLVSDPDAIKKAEQRGFEQAKKRIGNALQREMLKEWKSALSAMRGLLNEWTEKIDSELRAVSGKEIAIADVTFEPSKPARLPNAPKIAPSQSTSARPAMPRTVPVMPAGDGTYTRPQLRVLRSLAMWKVHGDETPLREMVAAAAGYAPGSGNFNNLVGALSTAGAIAIPEPGRLALAVDGIDAQSMEDGRDALLSISSFKNPHKKIAAALNGAGTMARNALAEASGFAPGSGNFNNLVGKLNSLCVSYVPSQGHVALSDWAQELLNGFEVRAAG